MNDPFSLVAYRKVFFDLMTGFLFVPGDIFFFESPDVFSIDINSAAGSEITKIS